MKLDEWANHYPTFTNIYNYGLPNTIDINLYKAANTPLPYIISLAPFYLFNFEPSIKILRITNAIISFITIVLLILLLMRYTDKLLLLKVLIILFYPYFLKPSFSYYMAIYGLLFFIWGLTLIDTKESPKTPWIALGVLLAFAILSQQFYLLMIIACAFIILNDKSENTGNKIINIIKASIPAVLLLTPLCFMWEGLIPVDYSYHRVSFDVTKITSILVIVGGLLLPVSYYLIKNVNKKHLPVLILISLFLVFLFSPQFAYYGGKGRITGYTFHAISLIENNSVVAANLVKVLLASIALSYFYLAAKRIFEEEYKLLVISIIVFAVGFIFNELMAERHLLPLTILIYVSVFIILDNSKILIPWAVFQMIFGSYYFYYYMFIQPSY